MQYVLHVLVPNQRSLTLRERGGADRRKLANVSPEETSGGSTTEQFIRWNRSVNLTKHVHGFPDQELAILIASEFKGSANESVEILELEVLSTLEGLRLVQQILDQAHGNLGRERVEGAYVARDQARVCKTGSCLCSARVLSWRPVEPRCHLRRNVRSCSTVVILS